MANQTLIEQIQQKKAEIIAKIIIPHLSEDDTSSEVTDKAEEFTTDQTVVEMVLNYITALKEDVVNEDPGNEEAEELLTAEEEEFYAKLADSESED